MPYKANKPVRSEYICFSFLNHFARASPEVVTSADGGDAVPDAFEDSEIPTLKFHGAVLR